MKLHILGICGTFMGSIALIARELGHEVTGSDENVYPPMSTMLEQQGVEIQQGYLIEHLSDDHDLIMIGNTMSRGHEIVEYILNHKLPYCSAPEWLYQNVLRDKHVLAVSGTHGKTTTTSMLSWILEYAGLNPSFLIGGVAENFSVSSRLTNSKYFVIEADEYDTAFFDKRSKFVHYHPDTLVINNLEFDHADIFDDIEAIKTQFHHLIRTVPNQGKLVINAKSDHITKTLNQGCWTPIDSFSIDQGLWKVTISNNDYSQFEIQYQNETVAKVDWPLIGKHNAENALAAVAAANHIGIDPKMSSKALAEFKSVKRRLEKIAEYNNICLYDDFAHHPTAIELTIDALRNKVGDARIIVILEPRSNTMKSGVHGKTLAPSLSDADRVFLYQSPDVKWNLTQATESLGEQCTVHNNIDEIVKSVVNFVKPEDHIVIMSNGSFSGIHITLTEKISNL